MTDHSDDLVAALQHLLDALAALDNRDAVTYGLVIDTCAEKATNDHLRSLFAAHRLLADADWHRRAAVELWGEEDHDLVVMEREEDEAQ